jgi:TonB family protein
MVIPSVLLSLALAPPVAHTHETPPRLYGHTWPLMLGDTRSVDGATSIADVPPRLLWMPDPRYPVESLERHREGHVVVKVKVDTGGHVRWSTAVVEAAHAEFAQSVREALVKAEFVPAICAGSPTEAWVIVAVYFDLYVDVR